VRNLDLVVVVLTIGLGSVSTPALGSEMAPAAPPPVAFAKELARTFAHPRCANCHEFTTKGSAIAKDHERKSPDCKSCHSPAWKAPKPKFSFGGLSPQAICERIKRNTPELTNLEKHLKKDGAIIWSLVSGRLVGRQLERAWPGDRKSWFAMVDRWIAGGSLCRN